MISFRDVLVAGVTLLVAAPAFAQTIGQASGQRQEASVHVQTSLNFFVPGPVGDSEEAQKVREKARRSVYEMAARECEVLREVIAKECRMESITSNIGRQQFGQQQVEGYTVNGSANFQIILK
jgi:hypothetical protein